MTGGPLYLADEAAMLDLGRALARCLDTGLVVHLEGQLGAGKTTLVRGLLRALGHNGAVKSPTYTLVEPYPFENFILYHFDLYRLGDPEELEYLGIRDYLDGHAVALIEWPDKGRGVLPEPDLRLCVDYHDSGRTVTLLPVTAAGQALAACLAA